MWFSFFLFCQSVTIIFAVSAEMFAHTFSLESNPGVIIVRLSYNDHIWPPCSILSLAISFIPSPSAHRPVIFSPLQLIPQLTPLLLPPSLLSSLWPCLLGLQDLMKWKLFPTIILPHFFDCILQLHSPLISLLKISTINGALHQAREKSSSPWQITTLLGVSTLSKPAVCLHKKYGVHNLKRVKVSPALQNTDFIWISPTHLSLLLW